MSPLRASGASASQGHVRASGASISAKAPADGPAGQAEVPAAGMCVAPDVAIAAQLACLLEATVAKPGNVSPGRPFADLRYEDFLAGAAAIGAPLAAADSQPLGVTIRAAIDATARWTRSNTNLGIVLLLAPIAKAARQLKPDTTSSYAVSGFRPTLRDAVRHVLELTTIEDARDVYAAIRCAAPGGLGTVDDQDVADEPTRTLVDVMRLAAGRDSVAREYATAYELTFVTGLPALDRARRDGLSWQDAIVETFLTILATTPDTHIARRGGAAMADEVSRQARATVAAGGVRSAGGREAIERMDRGLRDARHIANPGTTADLTAAAIYVALLGGAWRP
jgi:triphosphoribosyl-dephospho-CoA synthase